MSDLWVRRGVGHYTEATDADLRALGYVRVWQDCPNSLCVDGFTTVERNGNTEILTCLDCDGSGKVPAEGVVPVVRSGHKDRWYQSFTGFYSGVVIPARLIDGEDT